MALQREISEPVATTKEATDVGVNGYSWDGAMTSVSIAIQ